MQRELPFVELILGDLTDLPSLIKAVESTGPDEVYNLGAVSFVAISFNQAELTANVTGLGVLRMLDAIRIVGGTTDNPMRFYQASSSEMFGKVRSTPQDEMTPYHPARRTAAPRCSDITSRSTTARAMGCSPALGSSSTTRARGTVRSS